MAYISDKMGLRVWDQLNDPYDHDQLADNWNKISYHDHTPGRGVQIPTEGLADGAVTAAKLAAGTTLPLADNSVTQPKIADNAIGTAEIIDGSVTGAKILDGTITDVEIDPTYLSRVGISSGATIRRGKSIISAAESRTNVAYGLLGTPDRVQNITLPIDGLIAIVYQATWQESVDAAARAAIFIGANQLKVGNSALAAPALQEASCNGGANTDSLLTGGGFGLTATAGSTNPAYTGDVTTGQVIGDLNLTNSFGPILVFAAAGTYDISVQFKSTSGSVTVKNRKLWVWTIGF
jgi:hypothetical protein